MKRMLNEEEKHFVLKNLETLKTDAEYLEKVEIEKKRFTIDNAAIIVKKQVRDTELELRMLESKLDEMNKSIKVLEKQLREGVDVIEQNKKEENKDE